MAFGAGAQIHAHITLFLTHYPTITHVIIYNRTLNTRLTSLLTSLQTRFPSQDNGRNNITFEAKQLPDLSTSSSLSSSPQAPDPPNPNPLAAEELKSDMKDAHIIVTATSSTVPLFPSSFVASGTHLCLIGSYKPTMHEVDSDLVRRAGKVIVDSKEACEVSAKALSFLSSGICCERE